MTERDQAPEPEVMVFVCGSNRCPQGGEHDDKGYVEFENGGSVACSKCGSTAFERDMLRLP